MEDLYYYKDSQNRLGVLKHKLSEEELGDNVEITEEEYNAIKEQKEQNRLAKANTPRNQNLTRITELKQLLRDSDYKLFKYQDGDMTDEEYAPIKAQRHAWRVEINQLEAEIENEQ